MKISKVNRVRTAVSVKNTAFEKAAVNDAAKSSFENQQSSTGIKPEAVAAALLGVGKDDLEKASAGLSPSEKDFVNSISQMCKRAKTANQSGGAGGKKKKKGKGNNQGSIGEWIQDKDLKITEEEINAFMLPFYNAIDAADNDRQIVNDILKIRFGVASWNDSYLNKFKRFQSVAAYAKKLKEESAVAEETQPEEKKQEAKFAGSGLLYYDASGEEGKIPNLNAHISGLVDKAEVLQNKTGENASINKYAKTLFKSEPIVKVEKIVSSETSETSDANEKSTPKVREIEPRIEMFKRAVVDSDFLNLCKMAEKGNRNNLSKRLRFNSEKSISEEVVFNYICTYDKKTADEDVDNELAPILKDEQLISRVKKIVKFKDTGTSTDTDAEDEKTGEDVAQVVITSTHAQDLWKGMNAALREKITEAIRAALENEITFTEDYIEKIFSSGNLVKRLSYPTKRNAIVEIFSYYYGCIDLSEEDLKKDFDVFVKAYRDEKTSKIRNIEKSIIRQNKPVQAIEGKDGEAVFAYSGQRQERTSKETLYLKKWKQKEVLNDFMTAYANVYKEEGADKEPERYKLLRRIRRLIMLYFYGEESVPKDNFDVWENHTKCKAETGCFIDFSDEDSFDKIKDKAYRKNIERYRFCVAKTKEGEKDENGEPLYFEDQDWNIFWLSHIENEVQRNTYKKFRNGQTFKLRTGYLSEQAWRGIINYLSQKYIELGKVVYHFGLEDLTAEKAVKNMGAVPEDLLRGINSFEYEQIKAEETLSRDISVQVSFAANTLGKNVANLKAGQEDILNIKEEEWRDALKEEGESAWEIFQFFGGKSRWQDFDLKEEYKKGGDSYDKAAFIKDLRWLISSVRNQSFHYSTLVDKSKSQNLEMIQDMMNFEIDAYANVIRGRFYSNNLPNYYKEEQLKGAMDVLYREYHERLSQVPSFNRIMKRNAFTDILKNELSIEHKLEGEDIDKWESALYFLFKEIYYNAFLVSPKAKDYFYDALEARLKEVLEKEKKHKPAMVDFSEMVKQLKNKKNASGESYSLSEICQIITTSYNMQNNLQRNVEFKTKDQSGKEDKSKIYQHYMRVMEQVLAKALVKFIKDRSEFSFIEKPSLREKGEAEEFLKGWKCGLYSNLKLSSPDDRYLRWYVMGHFINPRNLNLLLGDIRSYIQFTGEIERRANAIGNRLHKNSDEKVAEFKKVAEILEFCLTSSGTISTDLRDYFGGHDAATPEEGKFIAEDAYAEYLRKYLEYNDIREISDLENLKTFCTTPRKGISDDGFLMFCDNEGPIINRNVILTKLYGADNVLCGDDEHEGCISPVTEADIRDFYEKKTAAEGVRKKAVYESEDELKKLKAFQEIKNRVELRNVLDYSELINDLHSQLSTWCYLRERDLMYFQLGFHYLSLQNPCKKPEGYEVIEAGDVTINNAILYQLAACYTYGCPTYEIKGDAFKVSKNATAQASVKLGKFANMYGRSDESDFDKGNSIYFAGLELFENVNEHGDMIAFRNTVEHFHYYTKHNASILDMYSECFDRFMKYDVKFQKTVPQMLTNSLNRYFVMPFYKFESGRKTAGEREKMAAAIKVTALQSDTFTYKVKDKDGKKDTSVPARSDWYIKDIMAILESKWEEA